ncbi:MAG TPA: PAS domain S-box protein, partial [Pirellulales bacterium]
MNDSEGAANSSGGENIFETLVRMIEQQANGGMLASILLVDEEGKRLCHAAAPSLPDAYNRAIDGLAIGPCAGSCGTAAYRRESVYVSEIATDPLWAGYRELALAHGLQACWSTPIFSRRGRLLGTFAMYYPQPRRPSEHDLRLVDVVRRTVAIAVERDEAEHALRQREQSLHVALANSQTGTFRWDPASGVYFEFDENLKRLFGLEAGTPVRMLEDLADRIHPDDTPALLEAIERRRTGSQFEMEFRVLLPDGRIRWLYDRAKLERSSDGKSSYVVGTCTDITKRKRAEQESARLAAIVESSGDAIISKDLDGIITSWNRGAEKVFGYTADEAIGQSIAMLIPAGHFDESPQILERIRRGESIDHYETVRRRKDGELIDISLTVSPLSDGQGRITGASKIARNVTDRRAAERLQVEQSLLLEMIASGRPFDDCLQSLTASVSRLQPNTRACVLLADAARRAFRHVCAAELPASFTRAVVGAPISELAIGTRGEAVYAGHPVASVDIAADERWSPEWRELCVSHGIRACHS